MNYLSQRLVCHAKIVVAASGMLALNTSGCASEDTSSGAIAAQAEPTGTVPQPVGTSAMNTSTMGEPAGPTNSAPMVTNPAASGSSTGAGPVTAPSGGGTAVDPTASNPGVVVGAGGSGGGEVVGGGTAGSDGAGAVGGLGAGGSGAGGGSGGAGNGEPGSAGAAGTGVGGGTPVGGASGAGDEPLRSAGCGQTPPASERYTIDVGGLMREYILAVPEDYDPAKAYRLIFTWHPWGGSAQQVAGNGGNGYYGLLNASEGEAILVSPEGLDFGGNGLGWGNEGGQDIDFLRAMLERFDSELCFDHNRIFSTGFSFGGMMSNAVACAGLARAVAPMAGNSSVSGCENGTQPVAYMGFHGDEDTVVDISGGEAARDTFVERNGCGAEIASDSDWCDLAGDNYQPCTCTTYEGCQDGYPVTWCQYTAGHMSAPNSGETIWNFFSQF